MEPIKFKLLVILALVSLDSTQDLLQEKRNRICPTWYLVSSLGGCECGSDLRGVILCESRKRVELQALSCMTYQKSRDVVVVGLCPYARDINDSQAVDRIYIPQPKDSKSLNSFTCGCSCVAIVTIHQKESQYCPTATSVLNAWGFSVDGFFTSP